MRLRIDVSDNPVRARRKIDDAAAHRSLQSENRNTMQYGRPTDDSPATSASPPAALLPPIALSPPARLPKKEDAIFFQLLENATSDEYLEALLEFVQPQQICFADKVLSPPPAHFCVYLDGEQTVAQFIRQHGYVRLRQRRLYAYTTRRPAFRLTMSNVCPVLPNAVLEQALVNDLQLRLCSPITFVGADRPNPALRHVLGFEREVYCCASHCDGGDDDDGPTVLPACMVVQYGFEAFDILLSVDGGSRTSSAPKSPPPGVGQRQRTPVVSFDERTVASKRKAPSSATEEPVILTSIFSDSGKIRKLTRFKKQTKHL